MEYSYHRILRRRERGQILRGLVPPGILRLIRYLRYKRLFPAAIVTGDCSVDPDATIGSNCILRNCTIGKNVKIDRFTTVGEGTVVSGGGPITIGSFCSIAGDVFIWSENHNHQLCTTYPLSYVLHGHASHNLYPASQIKIGNDVWIGHRAIILPGAIINDGCVVAAGSIVVNKEYPAYSIIAGVPAKVIGNRFSSDMIDKLPLQWWNHSDEEIFTRLLDGLESKPA